MNRKVLLEELPGASTNTICPLRLLLVYALRVGAVAATSYDALLDEVRGRRDGRLPWAHPEWPVVCFRSGNGGHLVPDVSVSILQLNDTIRALAGQAGIIESLSSHDLRRGAAKDLSQLPEAKLGSATVYVAEQLGHSEKARAAGITKNYIGAPTTGTWDLRVAAAKPDPFGITPTLVPFKATRNGPLVIAAFCEENGMDPRDSNARRRAGRALRAEARKAWESTVKEKPVAPLQERSASDINASVVGQSE